MGYKIITKVKYQVTVLMIIFHYYILSKIYAYSHKLHYLVVEGLAYASFSIQSIICSWAEGMAISMMLEGTIPL